MHSSTTSYVALQNLYKQQHLHDLAKFTELLAGVLQSIGLPGDAIPEEEVGSFVKNVGGVGIVHGSPLRATKEYSGAMKERISESCCPHSVLQLTRPAEDFAFEAQPSVGICIALAILASEKYCESFGHWPGSSEGNSIEADVAEVERLAIKALSTVHAETGEVPDELADSIREVVRGGFATPPTTAAFFGGIVGQEVIKLVTNQYTPLDNTAVVDLVKSGLEKFKL